MAQHIEQAFEVAIEEHLLAHGWTKGTAAHFDRELALDPHHALGFIADTQPEVWADLKKQHGTSVDKTVIEWLAKALDTQGTLNVLRHGDAVEPSHYWELLKKRYLAVACTPSRTLRPPRRCRLSGAARGSAPTR